MIASSICDHVPATVPKYVKPGRLVRKIYVRHCLLADRFGDSAGVMQDSRLVHISTFMRMIVCHEPLGIYSGAGKTTTHYLTAAQLLEVLLR